MLGEVLAMLSAHFKHELLAHFLPPTIPTILRLRRSVK